MNAEALRYGLTVGSEWTYFQPVPEIPMKNQVKMLKVKIKSLAAEARIIKVEERRAGKDEKLRTLLINHRKLDWKWVGSECVRSDLRSEQRSALLAYAFVRRKPYSSTERNPRTEPDWKRVKTLVEKFGGMPGVPSVCVPSSLQEWKAGQPVA